LKHLCVTAAKRANHTSRCQLPLLTQVLPANMLLLLLIMLLVVTARHHLLLPLL
jgi:hypothetical protein